MTTNTNPISVTYSDAELRNLVEEYITQQKSEFTLKGVCSYVLFGQLRRVSFLIPKELFKAKSSNPRTRNAFVAY